jgi:hypothetical protein
MQSSKRKQAEQFFRLPNPVAARVIEIKSSDKRSTHRRQSDQSVPLPRQVFFPAVPAWME